MIDAPPPTHWYGAPWWTAISGAGQILAAVFTAWAAVVAKRAAKAAEQSVEVTKQTALTAEIASRHRDRAYVALADSQSAPVYGVGTPLSVVFTFKNVGVTPAYNVRFSSLLLVAGPNPTEEDIRTGLDDLGQMGTLAPSVPVPVHCNAHHEGGQAALTREGIQALHRRETSIIAAARLVYDDVFGTAHETRIAFHFDTEVMGFRFAPFYNAST